MADRIARVIIRNTSRSLRLVRAKHEVCQGRWSTGAEPAAVLEPGWAGPMQAESEDAYGGGVAGGVEGYVAYDVTAGDDRYGVAYVYWRNPADGVVFGRFTTDARQVTPDCGAEVGSAAETTYAVDPALGFHLAPTGFLRADGSGALTARTDLAIAFAAAPAREPATLFGGHEDVPDPVWVYEFRDGPFSSKPDLPISSVDREEGVEFGTVPDVTGIGPIQASDTLRVSGFDSDDQFAASAPDVGGLVVDQDPVGGTLLGLPGPVTIFVGRPPAIFEPPPPPPPQILFE